LLKKRNNITNFKNQFHGMFTYFFFLTLSFRNINFSKYWILLQNISNFQKVQGACEDPATKLLIGPPHFLLFVVSSP